MKMVCEQCGVAAEPAAVWTSGARMRMECADCGHLNLVAAYGGQAEQGAGASLEGSALLPPADEAPVSPTRPWLAGAPHSPQVAPQQCAKCGFRQPPADSCARCGFVFDKLVPGQMPWERLIAAAPADELARADELWQAALASSTPQAHEAFYRYSLEHELDEYAARRYRFHLADWPEDEIASVQLERMLEQGRSRLLARLDGERDVLRRQLASTRKWLLMATVVVGIALAILFFSMYPNLL